MSRATNPLKLGRRMKPTRSHRPAIWEAMLGTVYAMNDAGDVRYFDYRWDEAVEYAGVLDDERDPRVARTPRPSERRYANRLADDPRPGQTVLWVRRSDG